MKTAYHIYINRKIANTTFYSAASLASLNQTTSAVKRLIYNINWPKTLQSGLMVLANYPSLHIRVVNGFITLILL